MNDEVRPIKTYAEFLELSGRMCEIKELAKETVDKMVELGMSYDDYDYFRTTMNNEVDGRPIGKK